MPNGSHIIVPTGGIFSVTLQRIPAATKGVSLFLRTYLGVWREIVQRRDVNSAFSGFCEFPEAGAEADQVVAGDITSSLHQLLTAIQQTSRLLPRICHCQQNILYVSDLIKQSLIGVECPLETSVPALSK